MDSFSRVHKRLRVLWGYKGRRINFRP